MTNTPNYNLNIVEGTDYVNPLTQTNPNFEIIDTEMKRNADNSVTLATELKTGTVHALVRANPSASTFRFVATSDFNVGDTFTVDGTQVTALQTTGQPLTDKSFVINANVLCVLTGTVLTLYVQGGASKAEDSDKLGGQLPSYYATADEVEEARQSAISAGNVANQAQQSANEALNKTGMGLLWQNASPTSAFEAQTISLDLSKYTFVVVESVLNLDYTPHSYGYTLCGIGKKTNIFNMFNDRALRGFTTNSNSIVFEEGYMAGVAYNTNYPNNRAAVPMAIYGIK